MIILSLILVIGLGSTYGSVCERTNRLFVIERNKNGNAVQYDVCLNDNSDLADINPVKAYWVLENNKIAQHGGEQICLWDPFPGEAGEEPIGNIFGRA
jgi:hypothetical protein